MRNSGWLCLAILLTALTTVACHLKSGGVKRPPPPGVTCKIEVTNVEGHVGVPFEGRVTFTSNWVTDAEYWIEWKLPPGLSLDRNTGVISGTPTRAGGWTVDFRIRDKVRGHPYGGGYHWKRNVRMRISDPFDD